MIKYNKFQSDAYSSHVKITNAIGKNKNVLDVGCATGYISSKLKDNGCSVIGIESDADAARDAMLYCDDVWVGDIESLEIPDKSFDAIILADILEHLKEPTAVLKNLNKNLKDTGYIYISVPNIANWRFRLNLLFGKFEYEEYGTMDRTHLRFFTLKTIRQCLKDAGFQIVKLEVTPGLPIKPVKIAYILSKMWPSLFAFQFLITARK